MEWVSMTEVEKSTVLSYMFGRHRAIQPTKRCSSDFNEQSIDYLIAQMIFEIEHIPMNRKVALRGAHQKCHKEEFSGTVFARFLRREGMNPKVYLDYTIVKFIDVVLTTFLCLCLNLKQLAAQRFINYWECRRQVFGPDKYALRMTLSEALCDDVTALETSHCRLLPFLDSSGRQLIFWDVHRNTKKNYSLESMVSAT